MFSNRKQGNKYVQKILFAPPSRKNKLNANISLFFVATLPQKGIPPLSKSHIEAKARSIIETFTVESTYELPPPLLEVKITRFYILLLEANIVMDKKQLEKLENTMALLMKLETNGTLGNMLVLTFSQWYLYQTITNEYSTTLVPFFVYHLL